MCVQESSQLLVHQQRLEAAVLESEETLRRCEALSSELDVIRLQKKDKEEQLCRVEEELALKEARWLQTEARLQESVACLEQELELEREQHSKELESLQQTRGQLLKVSEQISSTMRSSQEQLAAKLQLCQDQLDQARTELNQTRAELDHSRSQAARLQTQLDQSQTQMLQSQVELEQSRALYEQTRAQNGQLQVQLEQLTARLNLSRVQSAQLQQQLHPSHESMESSQESLLIKESEVTRLQAKISSLERAADRQQLSLKLPRSPDPSSLSHSPHTSPKKLQLTVQSPTQTHYAQIPSTSQLFHPSEDQKVQDWLQSSTNDSSLDLPLSLKATLKEALKEQPWESRSSTSSFPGTVDHSWQGLTSADASQTSDLSFNPLTYMVENQDETKYNTTLRLERDEEQGCDSRRELMGTLVAPDKDEAMDNVSTLTGMLRFVNQTLAMQDDLSLWSSKT